MFPRSASPAPSPTPLSFLHVSLPVGVSAIVVLAIAAGAFLSKVEPLAKGAAFLFKWALKWFRRDADEKYRIRQRQGFARYVVSQLGLLAVKEDWRDDRFAELEAEVEVEGRGRAIRWWRHSRYRQVNLRREKSLSRGLARTTDSLVILEGEPGSGKSVALRHLAEKLARDAQKSGSTKSLIPLYVNLKEFRPLQRPVDGSAVRDFVVESLTRTHDRDVEHFLDEEFDRGMREGSWLLLLDSFDEIPDVLGSAESDTAVAEYAFAINEFLSGMRTSRAVVASREFRGPATSRVPRFRIVSLTGKQQAELIKKSGLKPSAQEIVHAGLAVADPELRQMVRNPMFLGLVCEYVRSAAVFPPSTHAAYDSYLEQRLTRDGDRLMKRYGVSPDLVRAIAEETAFCMTATEGLGLSPARAVLRQALAADGRVSTRLLDKVLDALEYTKLGRAADDPTGTGEAHFTFAHRRFQEYFATRVVLRAPDRIAVHDLLTGGRWRETAVTILQTQPMEAAAPLLREAALLVTAMVEAVANEKPEAHDSVGFPWPPGSLHLLQLLDSGLGRTSERLGRDLRAACGELLRAVWKYGLRHDRKWAVSVALTADRETTLWLTEQAFIAGSVYLGDAAFTTVSRMMDPPDNLYAGVRETLLRIGTGGRFAEQRIALKAQISRLPGPASLLKELSLLAAALWIDIILAVLTTLYLITCYPAFWPGFIVYTGLTMPGLLFNLDLIWQFRTKSLASTVIAIRSTYPFIPFIIVFSFALSWGVQPPHVGMKSWQFYAALVAATYFATWPFCVLHCSRHGCVPRWLAWPTIPAIAAAHGICHYARAFVSSVRSFKLRLSGVWSFKLRLPGWRVVLGFFFAIVLIVGIGYWVTVSALMYPFFRSQEFKDWVGFTILAGFLVFLAVGSTIETRPRRNDTRLLRVLASHGANLNAYTLLDVLGNLRTSRGANEALEAACAIDLTRSPDVMRVLSGLSFIMISEEECIRQGECVIGKRADTLTASGVPAEIARWLLTSSRKATNVVVHCDEKTHDLIARAIERVELSRQLETQVELS